MDLKVLQVFLAVCANLSFTQTASDLHMSVSAVSRAIGRLEDELGCPLFDRDRRSMDMTPAARRLQGVAERIVAEWRELRHALRAGGDLTGELQIFCSVTATHELLSPLLAAYRRDFPAVDVRLQTGDQADGLERVRRGQADVAVIARPEALGEAIAFLSLAETPLCLCLPRGTGSLPMATSLAPVDALASTPWILPERGVSKALIDEWLRRQYAAPPPVYARVAGHEAIVAMVSLGLGVAIVPRLVIEASGLAERLHVVSLASTLPPMHIGLCARAGRLSDPLLRGLWDVAAVLQRPSGKIKALDREIAHGR